jgi:hypothetical protein
MTATATRVPTPLNPIRIYMIAPDTGGPICGGNVVGLATTATRTGDVAKDVETALQQLFLVNSTKVGGLLNPVGALDLSIESVNFDPSGLITVLFIGDFPRPHDKCDRGRIRAQIWTTIRQFPEIKATNIFLNGGNFGDFVSNE